MGIRTTISGDVHHLDLSRVADDMLADVIADHAAERFRASNTANREIAGTNVAYSVMVDGRVVHLGRGEMFPERQVSTVLQSSGVAMRGRHTVTIDWLWQQLQLASVKRAIAAYGTIGNIVEFGRIVADPRNELLRFLLERYLQYRFPALLRHADQARMLWRAYKLVRMAGRMLGGGEDSNADPDILAWIASELRRRSPVLKGEYRDGHALYADQKFLMTAEDVTDDAQLPSAREFSFTNTVAWSRKIEFGKTQSGRDFVVSVPNRIYERVARDGQARFRGLAEIGFEMRAVVDDTQTPQRSARSEHNKPGVRFPSVVVRF